MPLGGAVAPSGWLKIPEPIVVPVVDVPLAAPAVVDPSAEPVEDPRVEPVGNGVAKGDPRAEPVGKGIAKGDPRVEPVEHGVAEGDSRVEPTENGVVEGDPIAVPGVVIPGVVRPPGVPGLAGLVRPVDGRADPVVRFCPVAAPGPTSRLSASSTTRTSLERFLIGKPPGGRRR